MQLTNSEISQFKKAAMVYRAINHPLRQIILALIGSEEKKVTDIYVTLRLEQSVASQQLAILRKANLVTTRRNGKEIFYKTNKKRVVEIKDISNLLLKTKDQSA